MLIPRTWHRIAAAPSAPDRYGALIGADLTTAFTRLISHYVFKERFGRPGKGNDKGKVEALVKFARRSHLTPVPRVASMDDLNADLEAACIKRLGERAGREMALIGERLLADLAAFRQLDMGPFEACDVRSGRVSSTALVRYRNVDYSVPTAYGHRDVTVKGFVDRVLISAGAEVIACHARSYVAGDLVLDLMHYLPLLEMKPGALDQAAAMHKAGLAPVFGEFRRLIEARMGTRGRREFIQVLRLMEIAPRQTVAEAAVEAVRRGVIGFDAVKQLVIGRIERRPPRLSPEAYPYLPAPAVRTSAASDYAALVSGRVA
jgi:hypothetical protein